tara:strand:- start:913 stop:1140 length:228 start_codon:yes stop_codon:yes gene_type:complete
MLFLYFLICTAIADKPTVVYKKETVIDFEELNIDGELVKPQGSLILERKKAKFSPMLELKVNFDEELKQSIQLIQ